ncbi:carboxyl-terminal processing protease [Flavobacterium sp. 28YEA47A]|uniref:S41 family peptidase n=1 Tax=Flavobacterium sp. 28YEA47A TaxID=3156276 RepID=UPI003513C9BD
MKNKIVIILLLLLIVNVTSAQTKQQVSQLNELCNVWGNLKYFHPEIATGKHNWDSIVVSSINQILKSGDKKVFQEEVEKIFQIAGENNSPEFKIDYSAHTYTYRNINHSWIDKSKNLTKNQKQKLKYNYGHPYQGQNYYAQNNPNDDGNIGTPNENPYPEMKMPETAYRLLGLFRFWNVINYYYPYKYATDKPWDTVLKELIPEFVKANDTLSYQKAVLKMAALIDDGHGGVFPFLDIEVSGKFSPPFYFKLIDNKAVVTKILDKNECEKANIRKGSVIEKINGITLKKRAEELWDYVSAGNIAAKYRDLHKLILKGKEKSAVYSGYNPDGVKFSSSVALSERNYLNDFLDFHEMTSPITSKMITNDITYLYASNITYKNMDSIMKPLMNTKAIILDLRNYPSTMPSYHIANYFLDKPTTYSMMTRNNFNYPGLLIYENTNEGTVAATVGKENPNPYQGKLILLVDYRTQSLPEFNCLILKAYKNTIIVGNQTAGADGNQTRMIFPGNYKISFSGLGIYQADGKEAQRVGIPIDIPVRYTIQDFINDKDPILERAIEFAKTDK